MTELVPAIDIMAGRTVRLRQGSFDERTEYEADPVALACRYAEAGAKRLHVVDLDGAKAGRVTQLDLAARMARDSRLEIDFGGGVRSLADVGRVLAAGIAQVNIGSAAIREPALLTAALDEQGPDRIILAADARGGKVAASGWKEQTDVTIEELIGRFVDHGLAWVLTTDIARDGMMTGPALDLYRTLKERFPKLGIIASGGVANASDLDDLAQIGVERAVVGKALLEGQIPLEEIARHAR
jgi:phosphoribosylformimino-5-aminoimidazole carboxamide ribotide isomerase